MKYSREEYEKKYKGKRIAVVGNGPSAIACDFSEYGYPLWVCNGGWLLHPTAELAWMMDDLHGPALKARHGQSSYEKALDELKECSIPVFTSTAYKEFDCLVEYPLKEVLQHFNMASPYFTETTNYLVAFAIMIGVNHIDFFGVDYINVRPDERAGLEFWAGMARGRGITLHSSSASHFLRSQSLDGVNKHIPDLYGYLPHNVPVDYSIQPNGTTYVKISD